MVKNTEAIRRQIAEELFESFWPFCRVGAYRVKSYQRASALTQWRV